MWKGMLYNCETLTCLIFQRPLCCPGDAAPDGAQHCTQQLTTTSHNATKLWAWSKLKATMLKYLAVTVTRINSCNAVLLKLSALMLILREHRVGHFSSLISS